MSNRVALVTGGGRGIGLGISEFLAKDGFDVCFCGMRGADQVGEAIDAIKAAGASKVHYVQADVSATADREKLINAIKSEYGRLDCLVNNAGVAPNVRADLLEASEESFERLIKINLQGPYFLTQAAANYMVEQIEGGADLQPSIINVSSISATVASVNRGDYCLTKAAISMATQLWAARLGEHNIGVYEIRPGVIKTDMTSGVTDKYDKLIEDGLCVQSRWGFPEDVGKATAMLARGDLSYSTGQVLMVDGGLTLQRL